MRTIFSRRGTSKILASPNSFWSSAAIELPTAFPYFAAILATLGAVNGAARQTVFVVLYNIVFVAPLVLLTAIVAASGDRYTCFANARLPKGQIALGATIPTGSLESRSRLAIR